MCVYIYIYIYTQQYIMLLLLARGFEAGVRDQVSTTAILGSNASISTVQRTLSDQSYTYTYTSTSILHVLIFNIIINQPRVTRSDSN